MGTLFFVDFDTIAGIKCCCRQDSFSVIGPKKNILLSSEVEWLIMLKKFVIISPIGMVELYICIDVNIVKPKKIPCRSICFCSTYYFLRQKKKLQTNILSNTLYMKWIGSFYLLYFKPKTSFKHLPILMRKLLLFCDILPGIRTIKIPSGF